MVHEAIETVTYKGYQISIHQDVFFNENPNEWNEDIQLVYDHIDFYIKSDYNVPLIYREKGLSEIKPKALYM